MIRVGGIEIRVGNRRNGDKGNYVGRPSPLGNPYRMQDKGRQQAVADYRVWLQERIATRDPVVCKELERLRLKARRDKRLVLVCWCAPLACHAEVVAGELAKALADGRSFACGG